MDYQCFSHFFSVARPVVIVNTSQARTLSISWSSGGSLVLKYLVMWERDTSGECLDVDEDRATVTDGSTSYTIKELEEDSSYTITVTIVADDYNSLPISGMTDGASKDT